MVAPSIQVAELDAKQLFEYLQNILRTCLPECLVNGVQVEGRPKKGGQMEWFLVGQVARKINIGHTKRFAVPFNPEEPMSEQDITALIDRLVPAIRFSFQTNQPIKWK